MPAAGVSFEQVAATAAELVQAGQTPTQRAVRAALGTGSATTIQTHLNAWRAQSATGAGAAAALSPELLRAIQGEISRAVEAATAALRVEMETAEQERDDLLSENERLVGEVDDLRRVRDGLEQARSEAVGARAQLQAELDAVRAELVSAQQHSARREFKLGQVERIEQELAAARAEIETLRTARADAEKLAAVLDARFTAATAQIDDFRRMLPAQRGKKE